MTSRFERVRHVVESMLAVAPEQQASTLDQLCSGDDELRREASTLLEDVAELDGFLDPPNNVSHDAILHDEAVQFVGAPIGSYRLCELIGIGGMGAVYRAQRVDNEFESEVAIKIVSTLGSSARAIRRFRHERQLLASLQHPHIARLLDGGTTDNGMPYIVMDLIDGTPIDVYCRRNGLSTAQRLSLFLRVCDAVSYAHTKLIVHCDLKPANLLVTPDGEPRLLDFGVARLWTDMTRDTSVLEATHVVGASPYFASPEQLTGGSIGTASDVYALGKVLLSMLDDGSSTHEHDIEAAIRCATREQPEERYPTVDQLADDVRRVLEHRPILAARCSVTRRAALFCKRNVSRVIAAVALCLIVMLGTTLSTIGFVRESTARKDAQVHALRTRQIGDFLGDVLALADPLRAGADVSLADLLTEAVARLDNAAEFDPLVEADLRTKIGVALRESGALLESRAQFEHAIMLYEQHGAQDIAGLSMALRESARAFQIDNNPEAKTLYRRVLSMRRSALGRNHVLTLESMLDLASLLRKVQPHREEAARLLSEVRRILRESNSPHPLTRARMHELSAFIAGDLSDIESAMQGHNQALTLRRSVLSDDDPRIASSMFNLAGLHEVSGDVDRARALLEQAISSATASGDQLAPAQIYPLMQLARMSQASGDFIAAEQALTRCLDIAETSLPASHHMTLLTHMKLGHLFVSLNRLNEADGHFLSQYNGLLAKYGEDHHTTIAARQWLDWVNDRNGSSEHVDH